MSAVGTTARAECLLRAEDVAFPGFHGFLSTCTIEAIRDHERRRTIIVVTDGEGTSITNAAETVHWLARLLCEQRGVPLDEVVHVEHYRPGKGVSPARHTYQIVRFEVSDRPTFGGGYGKAVNVHAFLSAHPEGRIGVHALMTTRYERPEWRPLGAVVEPLTPERLAELVP